MRSNNRRLWRFPTGKMHARHLSRPGGPAGRTASEDCLQLPSPLSRGAWQAREGDLIWTWQCLSQTVGKPPNIRLPAAVALLEIWDLLYSIYFPILSFPFSWNDTLSDVYNVLKEQNLHYQKSPPFWSAVFSIIVSSCINLFPTNFYTLLWLTVALKALFKLFSLFTNGFSFPTFFGYCWSM